MSCKITLIKSNTQTLTFELHYPPTHEQLSRWLGGGTPERVHVLHNDSPAIMIVDGNGHYKNLSINATATQIYHAFSLAKGRDKPDAFIVGDAILIEGDIQFFD